MTATLTVILLGIIVSMVVYGSLQAHEWHRKHAGNEKLEENKHYHGRLFYFNKDDKRIFVPKRNGGGYTINFANPLSILAGIIIITGLVLFAIMSGSS